MFAANVILGVISPQKGISRAFLVCALCVLVSIRLSHVYARLTAS